MRLAHSLSGRLYVAPGADTVDGVQSVKVNAVVTNEGNEAVKLLNDPRSLLNNVPTESFSIVNANGQAPRFNGIRVKYVPQQVVANNNPEHFIVLTPGKSVSVEHDCILSVFYHPLIMLTHRLVSQGYDFSPSGASKYTVDGNNILLLVDKDNNVVPIQAETSVLTTSLSGNLNKVTKPSLQRRTSFQGCNGSQQVNIITATQDAANYTSSALK